MRFARLLTVALGLATTLLVHAQSATTQSSTVGATGNCSTCKMRRSADGVVQIAFCLPSEMGTINDCEVVDISDTKQICMAAGNLASLDPCGGGLSGPPYWFYCAPGGCIERVKARSLLLRLYTSRI
jgi:hypothetical protein